MPGPARLEYHGASQAQEKSIKAELKLRKLPTRCEPVPNMKAFAPLLALRVWYLHFRYNFGSRTPTVELMKAVKTDGDDAEIGKLPREERCRDCEFCLLLNQ